MSADEAIEHYGTLAQRVFSDAKLIGGDGKFKASKLEDVLKEIIEKKTGQADERMMDPRPEGEVCKTCVIPEYFCCCNADRLSDLCALCLR